MHALPSPRAKGWKDDKRPQRESKVIHTHQNLMGSRPSPWLSPSKSDSKRASKASRTWSRGGYKSDRVSGGGPQRKYRTPSPCQAIPPDGLRMAGAMSLKLPPRVAGVVAQ